LQFLLHVPLTKPKGEVVEFIESFKGPRGIVAGMANRDASGKPIVYRANFASSPPEFQLFIDRHECAHQTGDIDQPHPARNSPAHLMNEAVLVFMVRILSLCRNGKNHEFEISGDGFWPRLFILRIPPHRNVGLVSFPPDNPRGENGVSPLPKTLHP
jgi:hypothetical protein